MENITAVSYAIIAGIVLVIVLYLAYIMIPLLILGSVMFGVFLINKPQTTSIKKTNPNKVTIRW